ncbi:recombinase family protein [Cyanobium sp. BA5m-21]|uniref:recombinase family protein n=1 Tax=unclassified Cyanobium TaxID=2627006 RepID=UPI0020CCD851|nr:MULTISPECIES: recombinase family protein [unclassified Cyanobium]MCP9903531.1 recombinase family protein [Cyanobium sp. BA5m-10]MCP9908047.1 recombinase family protein [Cyanobium sp. BA5m-21]
MADSGNPVQPKRLCWSYARTSTTRQAREDRSGMERQQQALAAWLADHTEFQLQEALVDPGLSASTGANRKRGALGRFIAAAQAGQVPPDSVLVVESFTRFSREEELSVVRTLMSEFWSRGLGLAVCSHGCTYSEELILAEPHRMHMLWGSLSQARQEADERSRRSKGGARRRERLQEEGEKVAAASPWWVQRDPNSRHLVRDANGNFKIDPLSKATIWRAVELAINGMGTTLIAQVLNEEERPLPPTAGRRNQYRDAPLPWWDHSRVSYLLRHPALLGDLVRRDGRTIAGFYPPVLSVERWGQLRAAMANRDKLKGGLRGGGQKVRNLFMGITRCAVCSGPFSFHDSSERARIGHPGYMACRPANRRNSPGCSNSGYISYQAVEDHCLTRLAAPIWAELLGNSDGDARITELQALVDELEHALRPLETSHADAKRRLGQLFVDGASDLLMEASEDAVASLRDDIAAKRAEHYRLAGELQLERAKPTGEEAAAELKANVFTLWRQLDAGLASPAERRAFNRWLRCHQPSIQFLVHPAQPGTNGRGVELVVGGVSAGTEPLAPVARRMARTAGVVEPYAKDFATSQGDSGVIAWQEPLAPDELAAWPNSTSGQAL